MEERREEGDIALPGQLRATISVALSDAPVELEGTVVRATARTVVVELESGTGTLALAVAPRCTLALTGPEVDLEVGARPGNRVDDVPGSRRIELVLLDESIDLGALLG